MRKYWLLLTCMGIASLLLGTKGFEMEEILNTTSGFCNTENYGRIPVGSTAYDDEACVKAICQHNSLVTQGCILGSVDEDSGCRLVRGEGRYPNCCPKIRCD